MKIQKYCGAGYRRRPMKGKSEVLCECCKPVFLAGDHNWKPNIRTVDIGRKIAGYPQDIRGIVWIFANRISGFVLMTLLKKEERATQKENIVMMFKSPCWLKLVVIIFHIQTIPKPQDRKGVDDITMIQGAPKWQRYLHLPYNDYCTYLESLAFLQLKDLLTRETCSRDQE